MTKREHERLLKERRIQKRKQAKRRRILKLIIKNLVIYLSFFIILIIAMKIYIVVKTFEGSKIREKESAGTKVEQMMQSNIGKVVTNDQQETQNVYDRELMTNLKDMGDQRVDTILAQINQYPEDLLELLVKNPETLDFVINYPELKNSAEISENISIADCGKTNGIPLFLQWDSRWGYCNYGDNMIALTGCGPTCLSMVAVGMTGDSTLNPGVVARYSEDNGFLDGNNGTLWSLMTLGAQELGLSSREIPLDENVIIQEVLSGHPVICSMRPGDFTTEGHFIVLCGYVDGNFTVNDPNSRINSEKGWSFTDLQYQIKNLWAFS